jgi:hypothetical protein
LNSEPCFVLVFVTETPWLNASLGAGSYLSHLSGFRGPPQLAQLPVVRILSGIFLPRVDLIRSYGLDVGRN